MGVRCHGDQNLPEHRKKMQQYLMSVGLGDMIPSTLPDFEVQAQQKYVVPLARDQKLTFEYVKMDPRQLADEIAEQGVLWEHFDGFFSQYACEKASTEWLAHGINAGSGSYQWGSDFWWWYSIWDLNGHR